jgi:hypothetical protein
MHGSPAAGYKLAVYSVYKDATAIASTPYIPGKSDQWSGLVLRGNMFV